VLGRALATRLSVPYVELDAFMHQPGWQPRPDAEFKEEVDRATAQPGWVVDGNYISVVSEGPVWRRADTVVWLDLPRRAVMRALIARTVRRFLTREVLWNGNREPLSNFYSLVPNDNVVLWAWVNHGELAQRYQDAMTDPRWTELDFVRLRSRVEVRRWLESIGQAAAG
jgi:adenylate kinase family enzyme